MDKCKHCIRIRSFENVTCENCGEKEVVISLEGACLIGRCRKCGSSYVGSSFFAPCETDDTEYRVRLAGDSYSNQLLCEMGKILGISVLTLRKTAESGLYVEKSFRLRDMMKIQTFLQNKGIQYEIQPEPEYSEFYHCNRV